MISIQGDHLMFRFILVALLLSVNAFAAPAIETTAKKIPFSFDNAEVTKIIAAYAKASGRQIVIDPSIRGKATILNPNAITLDEAFSLMSMALAVNSFAVSDREGT